jgi:hypothetical protein
VLSAQHVVADAVLLANRDDVLSVCDEGSGSKHRTLWSAYPQFTDVRWIFNEYNDLCPIDEVGGEPVESGITGIETPLKRAGPA